MRTVGGRYQLVERIGSGAMGVVWRARDALLDRVVAVKQLRLPDLDREQAQVARARAMREARNAARLHHPNAIAVFDVVVEDDQHWLVMEHLAARSLAQVVADGGPLAPDEAARIGGHVAAALAAAHEAGIAHRDVKPSNVLIGHDGTVKLTDFGISRAFDDGTLTESGMIAGTPAYLAPEVARGEEPSAASDVFSLGATLYAATEGQPPFGSSENSFGLLFRAASGQIQPPVRSGALTGALTELLAVDPAERPTAERAVRLLADLPASAPERAPAPPRPRTGHGWLAPTVATAILLVAAVAITAFSLADPSGDAAPRDPTTSAAPTVTVLPAPIGVGRTADQVADFVTKHYLGLRGNLVSSWRHLDEGMRPSFDEYAAFWGQYDAVRPGDVGVSHQGGQYVALVSLTFQRGGKSSVERYRLTLRDAGEGLLITSSERV